ncbi:hypothetical protein FSP39_019128 [Pinctada imbricata]|uniref:C1q domain-containing protein n=1 Tax=Pinctada imbricata TaxID=66713 RepID=A0AA88XFZ3_PINIB|nr:hypothetical protein FSP39_019128 [Pinctada imbricata]
MVKFKSILLFLSAKAVGFFARLTKDIAHLGDGQTIEFDTVVTNEGNAYDPRHDHFIAPVAGLYQISVSIMSIPNQNIHCRILKNGVMVSQLYGALADYDADTQVIVLDLQAGDMIWVVHSGGGNERINIYNSYFSGFLIKQHF